MLHALGPSSTFALHFQYLCKRLCSHSQTFSVSNSVRHRVRHTRSTRRMAGLLLHIICILVADRPALRLADDHLVRAQTFDGRGVISADITREILAVSRDVGAVVCDDVGPEYLLWSGLHDTDGAALHTFRSE